MSNNDLESQSESLNINEIAGKIAAHALVLAMMVTFSISLVHLANRIVTGWNGSYLPWLCGLVSIEGMATWRLMRNKTDIVVYDLLYVVLEWIVLGVILKLVMYIWLGFGQLFVDIPLWQQDFNTYFFTPDFMFVIFACLIVWTISGVFSREMAELEGSAKVVYHDGMEVYMSDRETHRRSLVNQVFGLGLVMAVIATVIQMDFRFVFQGAQEPPRYNVLNVVFYFLFALAFLSLTHLSMLRSTWAWNRIRIHPDITRRWTVYALIFLAIISAIAFLLPTQYSLGLLSILGYLLSIVFGVISLIFYVIAIPFMLLFAWLLSFLRPGNTEMRVPPPPALPPIPQAPQGATFAWWEVLRSVLFWVFFLAVIIYAFYTYSRQNQELFEALSRLPFFSWVKVFGQWIMKLLRGAGEGVSSTVQAGIDRLRRQVGRLEPLNPSWFVNLRKLSPRQRVVFFYLALLRRGGESGLPRRPAQTPYEYAGSLKASLLAEQEGQPEDPGRDLEGLTDAFLEARYSQHEISEEHAGLVRRYWDRLRRALQSWRRRMQMGK